jgi:hypothetical protein
MSVAGATGTSTCSRGCRLPLGRVEGRLSLRGRSSSGRTVAVMAMVAGGRFGMRLQDIGAVLVLLTVAGLALALMAL